MYVLVFAGEIDETPTTMSSNTVPTLDQAFARIMCQCGLSYRFVSWEQGWALEMTDVERPELSPDPIVSLYRRPQDAQHDLMLQAVDGRVCGHVALPRDAYVKARVASNARGTNVHVA